jgi:tRNA-guanine family transglycosylase
MAAAARQEDAVDEKSAPPEAAQVQQLPQAKAIFALDAAASACDCSTARKGEMLGLATPMFTLLTSRAMPQSVRPQVLSAQFKNSLIYQLPYGDLVVRQDLAKQAGADTSLGCLHLWPHLKGHVKYLSFRNPLKETSVYGGDAVCSVDTVGGRKKVAPKDLLELQRVMRADIVAAPGEEVTLDVTAPRRAQRAVARASDWLKEILQAKASAPDLAFDWHVLASIQGAGDTKLREKACVAAASLPVAGVWIGGLGYSESLADRGKVLEVVSTSLPATLPRFLPLKCGNPIEVLQAVLLGIDVLEVSYPTEVAHAGIALIFDWQMPSDFEVASNSDVLASILPSTQGEDPPATSPSSVRQMQLRAVEWRDNFEPISKDSPVQQYSRAYLHHLCQVRELLGTMLLAQHNLYVYDEFFATIRDHINKGTLRRFASWFLTTQTAEPLAPPPQGPASKRRRT